MILHKVCHYLIVCYLIATLQTNHMYLFFCLVEIQYADSSDYVDNPGWSS